MYYVYSLLCVSKNNKASVYTGITTDWERRWTEHITGNGSQYTKCFKPICGSVLELMENRSFATKAELRIKKMSFGMKLRRLQTGLFFRP